MRSHAAALIVSVLFAAPVFAQTGVYTRAAPPDATALDRLNLTSAWTSYLPMLGRQDGIARVQVVDENQIFVQTKAGTLIALDAKTGREQWKFKYPAAFTDGYPVGVNAQFVYSVNVSKLFCHQRYAGTLEFETNLPETPATGPITDGDLLYLTFTGNKVGCYELPPSYRTSAAAKAAAADLKLRLAQTKNPADEVTERNSTRNFSAVRKDEVLEGYNVPRAYSEGAVGTLSGQNTPSITALQSVVPPYTLGGLNKVVSISTLPSLRQPYTLKPDFMTHNQITPSVSAIPPSLARVYELSNLRPPPFEPKLLWMSETADKVYHEPLFVPDNRRASARLWVTEDGRRIRALPRDRADGVSPQVWTIPAKPSGPLAGPFGYDKETLLGVLPLSDGQALGFDLTGGTSENPRYEWRANVGGPLNRKPIAAADGIYVGGDHSGCARINVKTGAVDWRTASDIDRVVAVTDAHVYARDRRGDLFMYAKGRVNDATTLRAYPLGSLNAAQFGVNVANGATDRILLAADNGLLVCLRDSGAKNEKVRAISPPPPPPEAPPVDPNKAADPLLPADPTKPVITKPIDPKQLEPKPGEPKPADPSKPADPVKPGEPKPADPAKPADPKKPGEPMK